MEKLKIYHNPRCSKSRCALGLLEDAGQEFEIVDYLKNPPSKEELLAILALLKIEPILLVRTKEPIWKEHFEGKNLTNESIIDAMLSFPQLIERPIVTNGKQAIIARNSEKFSEFLEQIK